MHWKVVLLSTENAGTTLFLDAQGSEGLPPRCSILLLHQQDASWEAAVSFSPDLQNTVEMQTPVKPSSKY